MSSVFLNHLTFDIILTLQTGPYGLGVPLTKIYPQFQRIVHVRITRL
jgi:hypothetical protein